MAPVVTVLAIVTIVASGIWFQYRLSRGRMFTPLWMAFSTTAGSILFVVAGTIGFNLDKHSSFVDRTRWSSTVIWWEVGVGLALATFAAFFWWRALRTRQAS